MLLYCCVVQPTSSGFEAAVCPASAPGTAATAGLVPDLFRIARRLRRFGGPTQVDVAALMLMHRLACDGPKRPSDLAIDSALDLSTVSRHAKALDDAGLITRDPDPDDGRSFRLNLTERGTDLMVEALRRRERSVEMALASWSRHDVRELHRLLGRLADDLERSDEETR